MNRKSLGSLVRFIGAVFALVNLARNVAADPVNISGQILGPDSSAFAGATIWLARADVQAVTNDSGNFILTGSGVIHTANRVRSSTIPRLDHGLIGFSLETSGEAVTVDLYNLCGARIARIFDKWLGTGSYLVNPLFGNTANISAGMVIAKLCIGNKSWPFVVSIVDNKQGTHKAGITQAVKSSGLTKAAGVVDTLNVCKYGFVDTIRVPVMSYEETMGVIFVLLHYNTVTIGTQTWLATNYCGTIGLTWAQNSAAWSAALVNSTPAYCYYVDSLGNVITKYGPLYNWFAVKHISDAGWHVPDTTELWALETYLGGPDSAGGKMKTTGTADWLSPNSLATNASGFSGLPNGYRDDGGDFNFIGYAGCWWTATPYLDGYSFCFNIGTTSGGLFPTMYNSGYGFSVRLVSN